MARQSKSGLPRAFDHAEHGAYGGFRNMGDPQSLDPNGKSKRNPLGISSKEGFPLVICLGDTAPLKNPNTWVMHRIQRRIELLGSGMADAFLAPKNGDGQMIGK